MENFNIINKEELVYIKGGILSESVRIIDGDDDDICNPGGEDDSRNTGGC